MGPGGEGRGPIPGLRPPFDLALCEPIFPRVGGAPETNTNDSEGQGADPGLAQALLKRNAELSPTATEQSTAQSLVTKVCEALEMIVVAPELFTAAGVEEVRPVGSYKKGTMSTKHNVADIVVVLKTLPTPESVGALGTKIVENMKTADASVVVGCVPRDFGCEIGGTGAVIKLLVTTIPPNLHKLEPELHLDVTLMRRHLAAVRQARWWEENAAHSSCKVLVRLLKDLRKRFNGLAPLNPWAMELLSHYAVMNTPSRQPLPLSVAFRRVLQLLSAGLFLPGSAGLVDPCEPATRIQSSLSLEQADLVCSTAQTLLRVLSHGGYKHILGQGSPTVATEMSVWDGIVVTPLEKAFFPNCMDPEPPETTESMDDS